MKMLRKVKLSFGGLLMLSAMIISDSAPILFLYLIAAMVHEIGHLLAAKLLRIQVTEIKFEFSGMRICTDPRLTSYANELLLALAGPVFSFLSVFAVILFAAVKRTEPEALVFSTMQFLNKENQSALGAVGFYALSSFLQGATNLLPITGFDGGRVLNCFLAWFYGEKTAERANHILSLLSAFVLWTVALYLMLKISAGLAVYTFAACIFFGIAGEGNTQET